jgi:hypothetical protein
MQLVALKLFQPIIHGALHAQLALTLAPRPSIISAMAAAAKHIASVLIWEVTLLSVMISTTCHHATSDKQHIMHMATT